ncbi:unnamed protein product [Thlaspi arvense]|uniref:F-box domain-containing protein n=1 Tax=Thlaspi arvense TaxID=13288 RepID=A0AAU9S851_THLAR|nr:unnamed protein product [Thlaspi arvense]
MANVETVLSDSVASRPEDVIVDIIARLPRCDYPTLSLVSKQFRSLVASPELYVSRSLLGCTEDSLYNIETDDDRWYILRRKANGFSSLVLISSLPTLPSFGSKASGSYVAVGSRIYGLGGIHNDDTTMNAVTIDCRSHTVQPLTSMLVHMCDPIADIIHGRIYVAGNSFHDNVRKKVMVVFNTETQKWEEPRIIKVDIELGGHTYKWNDACVVDDVLYYFDLAEKSIRTYDPKQRYWGVLNGVEELLAGTESCSYIDIHSKPRGAQMKLQRC